MPRILASIIPALSDAQSQSVHALFSELEAAGNEVFCWHIHPHPKLKDFNIPSHWDISKWDELYRLKRIQPIQDNLSNEIASLWESRVSNGHHYDNYSPKDIVENCRKASILILDTIQPDLFLCWAPLVPIFGITLETCIERNIPTLCIEWGFLPNSIILEGNGLYGYSKFSQKPLEEVVSHSKWHNFQEIGRKYINEVLSADAGRYQNNGTDTSLPNGGNPHVLVLGTNDCAAGFIPSNHPDRLANLPGFESSAHAAIAVAHSTNGQVVFKAHPSVKNESLTEPVPHNLHESEANVFELIQWADVVVSVATNLEYHVLSVRKPLVLLSPGTLSGKNIAVECNRENQLARKIEEALAHDSPESIQMRFEVFVGYAVAEELLFLEKPTPHDLKKFSNRILDALSESSTNSYRRIRFGTKNQIWHQIHGTRYMERIFAKLNRIRSRFPNLDNPLKRYIP